ncbi:uncharacterized protein B0H64DRAFT_477605 [Chaetomium fimeti]|uniref:Uncharacterized protein n=1 Tax=Chaetomium fimeti TaxID=1854472 RepID=A0AAE0HBD8_9PEZI|nr:hypothetical protein B0H64DRAFT_477605 [Chaetomium fimeti]
MQLSSLFLSATAALLAQVVSAEYYQLESGDALLQQFGPAKEHIQSKNVVFDAIGPEAIISLNEEGEIGNGFVLRTVGSGKWALVAAASPDRDDITGPFAVETVDGVDDQFVYKGGQEGTYEWVVCGEEGQLKIHLAATEVDTGCLKDIQLTAVGI